MQMFKEVLKVIAFVALSVFFLALAMSVFSEVAGAQEHNLKDPNHWYDRDCCDTKDCTRVEKMEFKPNGDTIVYTKMFSPITIPAKWWGLAAHPNAYNGRPRLRPSKDNDFHICAFQYRYGSGASQTLKHHVRCMYAPAGG